MPPLENAYEAADLAGTWANTSHYDAVRTRARLRWWERWLLHVVRTRAPRVYRAIVAESGAAALNSFARVLRVRLDTEDTPTAPGSRP